MTDLGASPGQMSVTPHGNAVVGEVIIQTFGVIDVGMFILLAFLICSEHLFWMLVLSLAYKADTQVDGLARGRSGVFKLQNCPLISYFHCLGFILHYAQISVLYAVV